MGKFIIKLKYFIQRLKRAAVAHFLTDISHGNFRKPLHFAAVSLKRCIFGYPYLLEIEPSNICNINCPLCPSPGSSITRKKQIMPYDKFVKVIDNARNIIHNVYITGTGEPLLHKDIWKMVRYASNSNLSVSLSTNATLFTKEFIEEMLRSGLDKLILSFDGISKESYTRFRAGANFESVKANIEKICHRRSELGLKKPFLEWQFILNRYNEKEVEKARELSINWGIDRFHVKTLSLNEHLYSNEEVIKLAKQWLPSPDKIPLKLRYSLDGSKLTKLKEKKSCFLAKRASVVLVDGSVSVCCMDINGNYSVGNAVLQPFARIWNSTKYRQMRKKAIACKLPICSRCPIF